MSCSVIPDIGLLNTTAGIHPALYKDLHRALSEKFPFAIYYRLENGKVMIRAIIDCRRSDEWVAGIEPRRIKKDEASWCFVLNVAKLTLLVALYFIAAKRCFNKSAVEASPAVPCISSIQCCSSLFLVGRSVS